VNEELVKQRPWKTVGIEIEYTDIIPQNIKPLQAFLASRGYSITHDASVESPATTLKGLPVKGKTLDPLINSMFTRQSTIGGEIVSPRINTENPKFDWLGEFDFIYSLLKQNGERAGTNRGSIHVHVNFPKDLTKPDRGIHRHSVGILRRAWILAGYLEYAFYKIGSFGRPQRGKNMDYIYYRPITGLGPPISNTGNGTRPILVYDDVLISKNHNEFFVKCADILNADHRYHPCRYMWINFYNLLRVDAPHLEFRVFNKTLRWDYLWAAVELCKAFVETCYVKPTKTIKKKTDGKVYGLGSPPEDDEEYFNDMIDILGIEEEGLINTLYRIFSVSPSPEYIDDRVWSHLNGTRSPFANYEYEEYWPESLSDKERRKIRNPNYMDIHKLKRRGETIFPEEML
jgi:hypothetical protein